ncbi:tetratricopeptide repeat-containing protein [Besnoitia besnoiti]|uniref:Tetratricopeptide repeat-containing protein n=1 Tax=Besnoitia besnoiti TaxID=94643 RepID=A0A2A9MQ30_BESBE|nr:tetratricopeptide repeat-containing protein [Besnoitia besnoiti]PFH38263.1 tetratricopeptide repeat-containing protein [Besnoitia besnoiti]
MIFIFLLIFSLALAVFLGWLFKRQAHGVFITTVRPFLSPVNNGETKTSHSAHGEVTGGRGDSAACGSDAKVESQGGSELSEGKGDTEKKICGLVPPHEEELDAAVAGGVRVVASASSSPDELSCNVKNNGQSKDERDESENKRVAEGEDKVRSARTLSAAPTTQGAAPSPSSPRHPSSDSDRQTGWEGAQDVSASATDCLQGEATREQRHKSDVFPSPALSPLPLSPREGPAMSLLQDEEIARLTPAEEAFLRDQDRRVRGSFKYDYPTGTVPPPSASGSPASASVPSSAPPAAATLSSDLWQSDPSSSSPVCGSAGQAVEASSEATEASEAQPGGSGETQEERGPEPSPSAQDAREDKAASSSPMPMHAEASPLDAEPLTHHPDVQQADTDKEERGAAAAAAQVHAKPEEQQAVVEARVAEEDAPSPFPMERPKEEESRVEFPRERSDLASEYVRGEALADKIRGVAEEAGNSASSASVEGGKDDEAQQTQANGEEDRGEAAKIAHEDDVQAVGTVKVEEDEPEKAEAAPDTWDGEEGDDEREEEDEDSQPKVEDLGEVVPEEEKPDSPRVEEFQEEKEEESMEGKTAAELKELGNRKFREGKYPEALDVYTEALDRLDDEEDDWLDEFDAIMQAKEDELEAAENVRYERSRSRGQRANGEKTDAGKELFEDARETAEEDRAPRDADAEAVPAAAEESEAAKAKDGEPKDKGEDMGRDEGEKKQDDEKQDGEAKKRGDAEEEEEHLLTEREFILFKEEKEREREAKAKEFNELRAVLLSNRAACHLHGKCYEAVIGDCTEAIQCHPSYAKAYLRRFTAHEALTKWHDAVADINKALELDPSLEPRYRGDQARVKKKSEEQFEKEKEEMLGKLKDFGNFVLGKVGLSLDNFKVEQNPDTGSYNISFQQNAQPATAGQ